MACVDDTEAVSFRIGQHDEVGVDRIRVPRHARRAEPDQTLDLGRLLGSGVDDQVEMDSRMFLRRCVRSLKRHSRTLARWRDEDGESVALVGEVNGFIPENTRPERHRTIDVIGAEHDCSKAYHETPLT